LKNLRFENLQPATQTALLEDPLLSGENGALRIYIPTRRKPADADAVVRFYCACLIALEPTPTATTAKRFGVTPRRVRQLTQGVRDGSAPFTASLPDSEALQAIKQSESASALSEALNASRRGSTISDPDAADLVCDPEKKKGDDQ